MGLVDPLFLNSSVCRYACCRIAKPVVDEDATFSGQKRCHALKFSAIMTPCGIIVDLAGAYPGGRNDAILVDWSNINEVLDEVNDARESNYLLYGDLAYSASRYVLTAYPVGATVEQRGWNRQMNTIRTSVEWGFAKVCDCAR